MSWRLTEDDKLDFTDREKVIEFFENDLKQAKHYLRLLNAWKQKGMRVLPRFIKLAEQDVIDSENNLALAKKKLGIK
jgi:hypothetical protein